MTPNILVSWIIPLYNCAPYIGRCIGSLLNHGLCPDAYEIIIVDDGSTDGGGEIADRLASEHHCIRVLHQKNAGVGPARNAGMDAAKGEFVHFVV